MQAQLMEIEDRDWVTVPRQAATMPAQLGEIQDRLAAMQLQVAALHVQLEANRTETVMAADVEEKVAEAMQQLDEVRSLREAKDVWGKAWERSWGAWG